MSRHRPCRFTSTCQECFLGASEDLDCDSTPDHATCFWRIVAGTKVRGWGSDNRSGQLGDGTMNDSTSPVVVREP